MLAREFADGKKYLSPIILSHHMMPGLKKNQAKMSKSDPTNALFMDDTSEDVKAKIMKAYCEEKNITENPCLEYLKYIVFPLTPTGITIQDKTYQKYQDLEQDFTSGVIHPIPLKEALINGVNRLLEPVRTHFATDPKAKALYEEVIAITGK